MELILQKNEYVAADNSITIVLDLVQTGFKDKELAVHIPESNQWNVKEITVQAIDGVFRYSIELQFFGSRSSRRTIPVEVLNVTKSGIPIIHKEKLDLVVRNLDKRQKPTVKVSLDRFGPSITGHLNPIIELSLKLNLNATAQLLSSSALRYTATVFVNQKEVWQQEAIETDHLKIETQDAFSKGKNRVEAQIVFDLHPERIYRIRKNVQVELRSPKIKPVHKKTIFSDDRRPLLEFEVQAHRTALDLSSFELISNHSTFSTEVISHYLEGNIHHMTIRPVSELWAGLHKLSASISNEFGFKSRNRTLSVFIDPWPPEVVKTDFMEDEKFGPTRKQLSFEVSDTKRQAVLQQPTDCIIGIGAGAKEALKQSGIYTVLDLVKVKPATVRVDGFSISELIRWNELAKVVYEVFIAPKNYFPFFSMSVEQFVLEVQSSPRLPEGKLKEMKENLKKLYTAMDIEQIRTLRLTEFIQTKGSQVKSASATLDGKETNVQLDQKSVIVDLPELSHGSHQVTLHLTDHCGNTSTFSSGFFMDIQPPLVLDSFPRPNAFVKQSPLPVAIKYGDSDTGIDEESVKITMDGNDLTSQAFITRDGVSLNVKNLNEGEHEMGLEVSDQVGNTLKERISFVLDTIPPLVSYDHHLQIRHTAAEKISLTGISSEPLASITLDGNQHLIERQKKFEIEVNLAPGENIIGGVAVDLAGNETMIQPVYVYRINQRQLSIQGRILDFKQEPVSNARIYVEGHNIWTQSNEHGYFSTRAEGINEGEYALTIAPSEVTLEPIKILISLTYGETLDLGTLKLLPSITKKTKIDPSREAPTSIHAKKEDFEVTLHVPNQLMIFPDHAPSEIGMMIIETDDCPVPLPPNTVFDHVVSMQPEGLRVQEGHEIPIMFKNIHQLPDRTTLPYYTYSNTTGSWRIGGFVRVEADNICSLDGAGIRHFSLVALSLPNPKVQVAGEDSVVPGADALKGGVLIDVPLPSFKTGESHVQPSLSYNSLSAKPMVRMTGVFKGLETLAEVEQVPAYTLEDEQIMEQVQINTTIKKRRGYRGEETVLDESKSIYIPLEETNLSLSEKNNILKGDFSISQAIISRKNVQTFKVKREISKAITHNFWPREIAYKYYLHFLETKQKQLIGKTMEVETTDLKKSGNRLPHNFSLINYLDPSFENGQKYPTGLYAFMADYQFLFEGVSSQTTSVYTHDFDIDPGFLEYLKDKNPTQYQSFLELKAQFESGKAKNETKSQWIDSFNALNILDTGSVILENGQNSPYGAGWKFDEVQQLYPVNKQQVLVINGDEKIIFRAKGRRFELAWKDQKQRSIQAITPDPKKAGQFYVSIQNNILIFNINTGKLDTVATIDPITKTTHQKRYSRRYEDVLESYTTQEYKLVKLPASKWRVVWRGFKSYIHTEEYQWVDVVKYKTVSKTTNNWDPAGDTSNETEVLTPDINSLTTDDTGHLYCTCGNTHAIYRVQLIDGVVDKICGKTEVISNSVTEHQNNDNYTVTTTTEIRFIVDSSPDGIGALEASVHRPLSIKYLGAQKLLFCDSGNHRIRMIDLKSGTLSVFGGNGTTHYQPGESNAKSTGFPFPSYLSLDARGQVYCLLQYAAKDAHLVKIDLNGNQTFIAGSPEGTTSVHVDPWLYKIVNASGLEVGEEGNIYVFENNRIVQISEGIINLFAGGGETHEFDTGETYHGLEIKLREGASLFKGVSDDLYVWEGALGNLWNVGLSILSETGKLELLGPKGHLQSKLEREQDRSWKRIYKDGVIAVFDEGGKHILTEDKNGNKIHYIYNDDGQLTRVEYPFGQFLEIGFEGKKPVAISDHTGRVTKLTIDHNRLLRVDYPDNSFIQFTYDQDGLLIEKQEGQS